MFEHALSSFAILSAAPAPATPPIEATSPDQPAAEPEGEEIVVLGTRAVRADRTLSSDLVTERMSPSSRSVERDLLTAAGAYRLSDALELISGVSNQNNRGGFLDNFAIRGFLAPRTEAPNIMSTASSPIAGWARPATLRRPSESNC